MVDNIDEQLINTVIDDKYKILQKIYSEKYHKKYLVCDECLNRAYFFDIYEKSADNYYETVRAAVVQEAHLKMKLEHPSVQKIIEVVEKTEYDYIVSEYVYGETLDEYVKKKGVLAEEEAALIGKKLCEVLNYLHNQKPAYICHNLKPDNIIIEPSSSIKLVDMGVFESLYSEDLGIIECNKWKKYVKVDTGCSRILISPMYSAPEQFSRLQADVRTDIYHIGGILFYLVTECVPFEPYYSIYPVAYNPAVTDEFQDIIFKCLKRWSLEERYQTCEELLQDLIVGRVMERKKSIFQKIFRKRK